MATTLFGNRERSSTEWVPRQVRCRRCSDLAVEERREREGEEITVLYACPSCFQWQIRRYFEAAWRR